VTPWPHAGHRPFGGALANERPLPVC
jgi:hypothetical protein